MRSPARRRLTWLGLALAVAGCAVGPNYVRPPTPAPPAAAFVSATPSAASTDQPPPDWWRLYDIPALDALVQEALVHNNSLLAAAANLVEVRAALSQARAGLFPSTGLSAGAQYGLTSEGTFIDELEGKAPPGPAPFYTDGLDVSYEVDLFGRVRRSIEAAHGDYQAQQAAENVIRISVAGETTRAYVDACAYADELAVARQSLDVVTQTYDITVSEARDGMASDLDVARAREEVEQVRATLPTFEGNRRTALFQLAVLTGQPPEQISQADDACVTTPKLAAVLPVGDVGGLFRRRPDVREAERQLAANTARIGLATAGLYPTITIGASVSSFARSVSGLGSLNDLSYSIGPLLNWTFPNTLVALAQIREARATASASYANFQAAVLQALQDTEDALTAYAGELDRNKALVGAHQASLTAFTLAREEYQLGRVSYLDLLTAQSDLVNASAALAASDQAMASDQVTVFKALGGGWEQAPAITPLPILDGKTGKSTPVK
ncbi:MAG TPA: TolC family protein [Caulobacteraceae bacterium]|nr:TolC family protein [Caulobacteraceae bacterium]